MSFIFLVIFALIYLPVVLSNSSLSIALARHLGVQNVVSPEPDINKVKEMSQNFIFFQNYRSKSLLTISSSDFYGTSIVLLQKKTFLHIFTNKELKRIPSDLMWLLEINDNNGVSSLPAYIPVDSDFLIVQKRSTPNLFTLNTVYQLKSNYPQIVEPYGNFTPENGLSAASLLPSITRRNFHNMSFVVFVPMPNLCDFHSICAHYKMWSDFGIALNFTQIDADPMQLTTIYGGEFDGEGIHAPFHATLGTDKNLLAVTIRGSIYMYIKDRLNAHGDTWLAFSKPFESAVWASLAGWLVICSFLLIIIHYFQGYSWPFIMQSAFTPFDAICCQGGSFKSQTHLSRWCLLMPRILTAILYPAYAAAVISFITVNIPSVPFNSIIGLYDDGTYQVGSLKADTFTSRYFNGSGDAKLNEIGKRMQLPNHKLMDTYTDNLNYLCARKFVFLAYDNVLDPIAKPCKILRVAEPVASAYAGLSLQQNSTYKKALKLVLLKMHSSGYIARISHSFIKAPARVERTLNPIAMPQVIVPFLIFGAGLFLSLLILSIEIACRQRCKQTNRRKHRGVILQRFS